MASVRYIILSACQSAGLYTQFGFESEAAAWIEKQGTNPCAYVYYRQGVGVAGFDNMSVAFGGSNPSAALRRVRDSLERSLEFRSERQTEVGGFPALEMTARAKKRVYGFGGGASPAPPTPTVDYMYFEAEEANSTVALTSTLTTAPNLEYSTDGVNWQEWQHTTADDAHTFDTLTLTAVGDRVYLRGDNPNGIGTIPEGERTPLFSHFEMTGKIAAGGNIMSLLDKNMEMTEIPAFGLMLLFGDITEENPNTSLTTAAAMPAVTSIGEFGCDSMYAGCTSLTTAAAMPALTSIGVGGCDSMYTDCTSLTPAAAMPALTSIGENGCAYMYAGCTFDMSDDGTALNFDFPTPPITAGETTYETAYDVASWMGNTNGFTEPVTVEFAPAAMYTDGNFVPNPYDCGDGLPAMCLISSTNVLTGWRVRFESSENEIELDNPEISYAEIDNTLIEDLGSSGIGSGCDLTIEGIVSSFSQHIGDYYINLESILSGTGPYTGNAYIVNPDGETVAESEFFISGEAGTCIL